MSVVTILLGLPAYADGQLSVQGPSKSGVESSGELAESVPLSPVFQDNAVSQDSTVDLLPIDLQPEPAELLPEPVEPISEPEAVESAAELQPVDSLPEPEPVEPASELEPLEPEPVEPSSELELIEPEPVEPASELEPIEPEPVEPSSELEPIEPESAEPASDIGPVELESRGWQFSAEPYFFIPFDIDADVTVVGRSTSLDLGVDDILELDKAFTAGLRLEAQNDRWSIILDGFYIYAEDSGNLGGTFSSGSLFQFVQQNSPGDLQSFAQQFDPQRLQQFIQIGQQIGLNTPIRVSADGKVSIRQITADVAVTYRAVDVSLSGASEDASFYPRLAVSPILGLRTNFLRQIVEVDTIFINNTAIPDSALPPIDREYRFSRTLVEPLVGAQIELALSERWAFGLRGDMSGFDIGADENFTWNLLVGAQYNISRNVGLQLAYRFNSFDFKDGEGLRQTQLDLRQNGLVLNAVFRF